MLKPTPNQLVRTIINSRKRPGGYTGIAEAIGISIRRLMYMVKAEKKGVKVRMHVLTLAAVERFVNKTGGKK